MGQAISDNEILNSYNNLIPYLPYFFQDEVVFTIGDTEKFLRVQESEHIKISAKAGDLLRPGGGAYECIKAGKPLSMEVAKEVFGVEVKAVGIPVKNDEGVIVGCIVMGRSLERQNQILNLSRNLSKALEKISEAINQISSGIKDLAHSNSKILTNAENTESEANNTDEILEFVKNVAGETNLLGLNAAIEAARAGEAGRGFNIVAQEIRKLSNSSSQSISQINSVLMKIRDSVSDISRSINETNSVFQEQASALQQITESMEELNSTAKALGELASTI